MSNSKSLIPYLAIIAGVVILWLLSENEKKNKLISNLRKTIDENESLTNEIKRKLNELIANNKDIEPRIANELSQIASLVAIKQDATAVLKLAKIIENLLIELYKKDNELKDKVKTSGRKKVVFADYLEHAKEKGIINAEDFHLLSVMKIIRNEEAHLLDVKKEKSRLSAIFISGMGFILVLCRILKKKTIEDEF